MDKSDVVRVKDHGVELTIPLEACVMYHGRDSIGFSFNPMGTQRYLW